jgi:hypothetical protein
MKDYLFSSAFDVFDGADVKPSPYGQKTDHYREVVLDGGLERSCAHVPGRFPPAPRLQMRSIEAPDDLYSEGEDYGSEEI